MVKRKQITGYDRLYDNPYEMLLDFSFSALGKDTHEILYLINYYQNIGYSELINLPYNTLTIDKFLLMTTNWRNFSVGCFIDKEDCHCFYSMICVPNFMTLKQIWSICQERFRGTNTTFVKEGVRISSNRILNKLYIEFFLQDMAQEIQNKYLPLKWVS